jgi:hypothetical protein
MTISTLANTPSQLHDSDLNRIANLVTVRDIFTDFVATFPADWLAEDVREKWACELCGNQSPLDQMALVEHQGKPTGTLTFEPLDNGKKLSECMDEIPLDSLITEDTPLTRAIEMFSKSKRYYFVVIQGNKFVGWLSYHDLYKLPFRLCLFAQLIAIEQKMLLVAQKDSRRAFDKLPRKRRDRAEHVFDLSGHKCKSGEHRPVATLLTCTTFEDKATILQNCCKVSLQIPSVADKKCMKLAKEIRNILAHPTQEKLLVSLIEREEFCGFIIWLEKLNVELANVLESEVSELD